MFVSLREKERGHIFFKFKRSKSAVTNFDYSNATEMNPFLKTLSESSPERRKTHGIFREETRMISQPSQQSQEVHNSQEQLVMQISCIREQMGTIKNILSEEKLTMKDLLKIKAAGLDQAERIKRLEIEVENLLSVSGVDQNQNKEKQQMENDDSYNPSSSTKETKMNFSRKTSISRMAKPTIDFTLELLVVKPNEYQNLSKYTRSNNKISLTILNEALSDIVQVCRMKYTILLHYKHLNSARSTSSLKLSSTPLAKTNPQTTMTYQKQILREHFELDLRSKSTHHKNTNNTYHNGRPWVSEDNLRDSCAFFLFGEITSRAILSSLRSLGRLKQINIKTQITYVLLVDSIENEHLFDMNGSGWLKQWK